MPFKSKKQQRLCYYLKSKGENKGWDCDEWAEKTDFEELPERKKKDKKKSKKSASLEKLEQTLSLLCALPGASLSNISGYFSYGNALDFQKLANNQYKTLAKPSAGNSQNTQSTGINLNKFIQSGRAYYRYKTDPKFKSFVDNPINRAIYGLGLHNNQLGHRFAALQPWQQYALLGGLGLGLVGMFTQNKLPFLLGGLALAAPGAYGMYSANKDVIKRINSNFQQMDALRKGQQMYNKVRSRFHSAFGKSTS